MARDLDWIALTGSHPAYARVRFSVVQEPYALALVDTNGDGREVSLVALAFESDEQEADEVHEDDVADEGSGRCWSFAFAYGRDGPNAPIVVAFGDDLHEVSADDHGWWVFFRRAAPDDNTFGAPERVA